MGLGYFDPQLRSNEWFGNAEQAGWSGAAAALVGSLLAGGPSDPAPSR